MRPTTSHQRIHTAGPTSQKFFVGSSNKKAKLVILQIEGLQDESTRKLCEKSLLGVYKFKHYLIWQKSIRISSIVMLLFVVMDLISEEAI